MDCRLCFTWPKRSAICTDPVLDIFLIAVKRLRPLAKDVLRSRDKRCLNEVLLLDDGDGAGLRA